MCMQVMCRMPTTTRTPLLVKTALFYVLFLSVTVSSDLNVTMITTPSGPVYEVASWVRFRCDVKGHNGSLTFQWYRNCSQTNTSHYLGSYSNTSMWPHSLLTTPNFCWDGMTCHVTDTANQTGVGYASIAMLTGVGLTRNHQPLRNNTIIVTNEKNNFGILGCHSASSELSIGHWTTPNNNNSAEFKLEQEGNDSTILSLELQPNTFLTKDTEGLYRCTILDELGRTENLHVWIYRNEYTGVPVLLSREQQTDGHFQLSCMFTGAPGIAYWYKDEDTFINPDGMFGVVTMLVNESQPTYVTTLTSKPGFTNKQLEGIYTCNFLSQLEYDKKDKTAQHFVNFYFFTRELGTSFTFTCLLGSNVTSSWVTVDNEIIIPPANTNNVTIVFSKITDLSHGRNYSCHGNTSTSLLYRKFTLAVLVPSTDISLSFPRIKPMLAGDTLTLECLAVKLNTGFSNMPRITWKRPPLVVLEDEDEVVVNIITSENSFNSSVRSVLTVTPLLTSEAGGYTCLVTLETPLLSHPINYTIERTVTTKIPPPNISITTSFPPTDAIIPTTTSVLAGTLVQLHCVAALSDYVNTPVDFTITWKLPNRNESVPTSDQSDSIISSYMHHSMLAISPVTSFDQGEVVCIVKIKATPNNFTQEHVLESEAKEQAISLIVQEPVLSVTVTPTAARVLDAPSYNSITLTCHVEAPTGLVVRPFLSWKLDGEPVNSSSSHTRNVSDNVTHTTLELTDLTTAGNYQYHCVAMLKIGSDSIREYSAFTMVTIEDSSPPSFPIELSVIEANPVGVTISWLVPMVTYTPETYSVKYGHKENVTDFTSTTVNGTTDIHIKNVPYLVELEGLQPNTTYYYYVLASNSNGSTASIAKSFTTPPPSISIHVTRSTNHTTATADQPFSLTCFVNIRTNTSHFPLIITWQRTHRISSLTSTHVETLKNGTYNTTTATLSIQWPNFHVSQAGSYTCLAQLQSNEQAIVTKEVIVQVPAPTVSIDVLPSHLPAVHVGHNITIQCEMTKPSSVDIPIPVTVMWRWEGMELPMWSHAHIEPMKQISNQTYQSVLVLMEVTREQEGLYECTYNLGNDHDVDDDEEEEKNRLVLPASTIVRTKLAVKELPKHNISVFTMGTSVAGLNHTMLCTVGTGDSLLAAPAVQWVSPGGRVVRHQSLSDHDDDCAARAEYVSDVHTSGNETTLSLHFPCLRSSQSGVYTCRAMSTLPLLGLIQQTTAVETLLVKFPIPLISLNRTEPTLPINYAGGIMTLECSTEVSAYVDTPINVTFSWSRNDFPLETSSRIFITDFAKGQNLYSSIIHFHTLSKNIDTGEYTCGVILMDLGVVKKTSVKATATLDIIIESPSVTVKSSPPFIRKLDRYPYNTFKITCICRVENEVTAIKSLHWREGSNLMGHILPHDNGTHNVTSITFNEVEHGVVYTELYVEAKLPGNFAYSCEAGLIVDGDDPVSDYSTTSVHIQGPRPPNPAVNLTATRTGSLSSANISWTITEITYLDEDYTLEYSTDRTMSINKKDKFVIGLLEIDLVDHQYSTVIDELEIGQVYYYHVLSKSEGGITSSVVSQFTAGFASSLFQLKLSGVRDCEQWVFFNSQQKKQDTAAGIISAVNEKCQCGITPEHLQEAKFICLQSNPSEVIYRARLYSSLHISGPENLVRTLQQWVNEGHFLLVAGFRLSVDTSCTVAIKSFNEEECAAVSGSSTAVIHTSTTKPITTDDGIGSTLVFIIMGVVVFVMLVGVVVVTCLIYLCCRMVRNKQKELTQEVRMKTLMEIAAVSNTNLTMLHSPGPSSVATLDKHNVFNYDVPTNSSYPRTRSMYSSNLTKEGAVHPRTHSMYSSNLIKEEHEGYSIPRSASQTDTRDSHIYYLNTPPLSTTFKPDPIYEPIADSPVSPLTNESRPSLPPRPLSHRSLYWQLQQEQKEEEKGSEEGIEEENDRKTGESDETEVPEGEVNDPMESYIAMSSVGRLRLKSSDELSST